MLAVFGRRESVDEVREVGWGDESHPECDLFQAREFQSLSMLDSGDVITRLEQRLRGAGVEPGHAAAKQLHVQLVALKIEQIQIGNFEFAARRRPQRAT